MGGFDDHIAIMGGWMSPSPSPRTLFSSMMNDDAFAKSIADSIGETKSGPLFPGLEGQDASENNVQRPQIPASIDSGQARNLNSPNEPRVSSRGGLLERMAARAGFNAPRLNTESIKPADLSKSSELPSPLTIPPGLSPTTLLDSPQFLSNSMIMPSPTTGKFSFAPTGNNWNPTLLTDVPDKGKENAFEDINTSSSFAFKPVAVSNSFPYFNSANSKSFPSSGVLVHSDVSIPQQNVDSVNISSQKDAAQFQQANFSKPLVEMNIGNNLSSEQTYNADAAADHSSPLDEPPEDDGDPRSSGDPNAGGGPSEDGFNWRKYGQKQVKGSEYPRSYYKCTHPNCPVKKKVERSHEGHITEIIYKGAHNHPKPQPNRRSALASTNALGEMQLDPEQSGTGANGDPIRSVVQKGHTGGGSNWRQENLDVMSSGQQYMNAALTVPAPNGAHSGDGRDGSSTFSNDEDDEDRVTHGSVSLGYDGEGDESESKRRRIETYASEISGATRAIREPRVVVQTTSEVDILDDGYRWRKYGQKVVKGNPNPRSYYKCTSAGCNVRKHVERASHDLKSVITTYEGKHNHDVPAARNSSHMNSGGSSTLSNQQPPPVAPPSHLLRPEPSQIHGRLERPSLGSFGLPSGRPQLGPGPGFAFGMNQPGLGMAGFGPNQGRIPMLPVHAYFGQQQPRPMHDMGFMMPKGEPKLEPVTESSLNTTHNINASSVYQELISRLPLGPHM